MPDHWFHAGRGTCLNLYGPVGALWSIEALCGQFVVTMRVTTSVTQVLQFARPAAWYPGGRSWKRTARLGTGCIDVAQLWA